MVRLMGKLSSAQRALNTLKELVGVENVSMVSRDAAIQRFEYTVLKIKFLDDGSVCLPWKGSESAH